MYSLLRPLLFKMEAEQAHSLVLNALHVAPKFLFTKTSGNRVNAMGIDFPHAVGLAAGLDKNGNHLDALAKLGFSFIELGTVTPKPQIGNPKPRLFRIPQAQAIINRMGFNNLGVDNLVENVKNARYSGALGINIGKNKDTSLEHSADDYLLCLNKVYPYASYVTINISSPNTQNLRQLQQAAYFSQLMSQLREEQKKLSDQHQKHVPLVVKVSPDENEETLKEMTEAMLHFGIEGIIATNTSSGRDGVSSYPQAIETGGLSGAPLKNLSTRCIRLLKQYVGNDITLIGVGGINSCADAQEKIDAGASLVQVYTGLIYQGPELVHQIVTGLKVGDS